MSYVDAILRLLGFLTGVLVVYGAYRVLKVVYAEVTSPLRDLPGPQSPSWIYGNMAEMWEAENSVLPEKWAGEYGSTMQVATLLGMRALYTADTKALKHVIVNTNIYQKPEVLRYGLSRFIGPGLAVVEGDKHKHQRKIMNPAFGPSQIRELTEIFVSKSIQLRDIWAAGNFNAGGTSQVDALSWLSRATLDVIGLAGFDYRFDAMSDNPKQTELNAAFAALFETATRKRILLALLRPFLPFLRTERDATIKRARKIMSSIGHQLLQESKAVNDEKDPGKTRDLLSLLIKSNMDKNIPEYRRMSDEEVLAQIYTFIVAGHETTSLATTWALHALTQDKAVQDRLRVELLSVDAENPTMDQLNALPYLDMVVRETMRIHAPIAAMIRTAVTDDVLPLNTPITDRKGVIHDALNIRKGQIILIPVFAVNCDKSIWGEDALEFRPERWEKIPEAAGNIPGVWGNMLTFHGGPHACIGYRFSIVEMKALLFTLIRAFEFELAVPAKDLVKKSLVTPRPVVTSDREGGNQMPLLIRPVVKL
ncbi:cytochrome P450 [Lyophyllum atratum]|nr:cytochrome P450 [Lyophyllum atratum]